MSYRNKLTATDAGAASIEFQQFEEILAQELHCENDWLQLSSPALECLMIYVVRAVRYNPSSERYEAGLSHLYSLTSFLERQDAAQTASKLLLFLDPAYDSQDRRILGLVRRLEKLCDHRRKNHQVQRHRQQRHGGRGGGGVEKMLVFEELEEEEEVEETEVTEEEETEVTEKMRVEQVVVGADQEVGVPVDKCETSDVSVQFEEIGVEEVGVQVDTGPPPPALASTCSTSCQTEFDTLEKENERLRRNIKHAELLLKLQVVERE